jgi:hypothetical protein
MLQGFLCRSIHITVHAIAKHPFFYRVDIEAQMTMFAYYYVGIGLGVLIVSYFQVSGLNFLLKVLSLH